MKSIPSFLLAIAERPDLLTQLWRAFSKMQKAENQAQFRAGLIQLAKSLETCYTEN